MLSLVVNQQLQQLVVVYVEASGENFKWSLNLLPARQYAYSILL